MLPYCKRPDCNLIERVTSLKNIWLSDFFTILRKIE